MFHSNCSYCTYILYASIFVGVNGYKLHGSAASAKYLGVYFRHQQVHSVKKANKQCCIIAKMVIKGDLLSVKHVIHFFTNRQNVLAPKGPSSVAQVYKTEHAG